MAKELTREQVQGRKDKAVRFTQSVLDDPERASEIEDESLESYAERRGFIVSNPAVGAGARALVGALGGELAALRKKHGKKRRRGRTDNPGDSEDAPAIMETFGVVIHGRQRVATKKDLEDQIADLQDENQDLQDRLDAVYDLVCPEDEEEEENGDEVDDEDEDDNGA